FANFMTSSFRADRHLRTFSPAGPWRRSTGRLVPVVLARPFARDVALGDVTLDLVATALARVAESSPARQLERARRARLAHRSPLEPQRACTAVRDPRGAVAAALRPTRCEAHAVVHRRQRPRAVRAHVEADHLSEPAAVAPGTARIRTQLALAQHDRR